MAPTGYKYDIFLSYSRTQSWPTFVESRFLPILAQWVSAELGRDAAIFMDTTQIRTGQRWPEELEGALATSRVMVALWSRNYFGSDWCVRELGAMLARADALRAQSRHDGIVFPLAIHDCRSTDIPDCVSHLQTAFIHEYSDPFMHPRGRLRERLSAALRPICEEISVGIGRVTDDSFAWPMPDCRDYLDCLRSRPRSLVPVPSLGDVS